MKPTHSRAALALFLTTAAAVLTLAACEKSPAGGQAAAPAVAPPPGALPLDSSASTVAYAPAPAAVALPPAPPARRAPPRVGVARYDYVNRAAQLNGAFADSPPDYAVNYQGARPWYWRARDGAYRVVENTPEGQRYYYYNPGEDQPYLVRDSRYAYGFDQGGLSVVYDSDGRPLPDGEARHRAYLAGQYLVRAQALYLAAERERHEAAYASNWAAASAALAAQRRNWDRQQRDNPDWREWRDRQGPPPADWRAESAARQAYAAGPVQSPRQAPPVLTQAAVQPPDPRPAQPQYGPAPTAYPPTISAAQDHARQVQAAEARQTQQAAQAREQQAHVQAQAAAQAQRQQAQAQAQAQSQAEAQRQQAQAAAQAQLAARTRAAEQAQRQQARAQALDQAQAARRADVQAQAHADAARRQQLQADAAQARQAEQARLQQAGQKQGEAARRKAALEAAAAKDAPRSVRPPKPDGQPQP